MPMTKEELAEHDRKWKEMLAEHKKIEDKMLSDDRKARANKTIVGRYLQEAIADGYAYYQIVKENKTTVKIKHVPIGDGYRVGYWGDGTTIRKDYALKMLNWADTLNEIFSKGRK